MFPGRMDLLTIIPIDEKERKGIPFVKEMTKSLFYKLAWQVFWNYFESTWMKKYGIINYFKSTSTSINHNTIILTH
jgi:hypothetical protein